MGWADCGTDSRGRRIGYAIQATCDHETATTKCLAKIDRGLAFACGGMHGDNDPEGSCEGYFCAAHRYYRFTDDDETMLRGEVCARCLRLHNLSKRRAA